MDLGACESPDCFNILAAGREVGPENAQNSGFLPVGRSFFGPFCHNKDYVILVHSPGVFRRE